MSKSTNQSLALLSVVAGSISMLDKSNAFARVDMRQMVKDAFKTSCKVIERWPGTGDEVRNVQWITKKVHDEWHPFIMADTDRYGSAVLACINERIIADLKEKLRDKRKLALLAEIEEPVRKIHDFCDQDGRNFLAYAKADYALDELYKLVEWGW